jgi:hypothetical protein
MFVKREIMGRKIDHARGGETIVHTGGSSQFYAPHLSVTAAVERSHSLHEGNRRDKNKRGGKKTP